MTLALAAALTLGSGGGFAFLEKPKVEELAWLVGRWENEDSSETWTPARDGQMLGVSQTLRPGKSPFYEYLRLESVDGVLTYFASPGGRSPATPFQLAKLEKHSAEFRNPDHDFPQVIRYRRSSDELHAEIEGPGSDGQMKSVKWVWTRAKL